MMPAYRSSKVTQGCDTTLAHTLSRAGDMIDSDTSPVAADYPTVTELGRERRRLRAGDFVSARSCTAPFPTPRGCRFETDLGPLGRLTVELS